MSCCPVPLRPFAPREHRDFGGAKSGYLKVPLFWLVVFVARVGTAEALAADRAPAMVGTISPAAAVAPVAEAVPLGSLARGLVLYFPQDNHLSGFSAQGTEGLADFARTSAAFRPDLARAAPHAPRFLPGRFGQGVLVEYQGKNQLPALVASAESAPDGFAPLGKAILEAGPGLEGRACLGVEAAESGAGFQTRPIAAPLTRHQTFSLYVKGPARGTLQLAVKDAAAERSLGDCRTPLTGQWQRVWLDYEFAERRDPPYESRLEQGPPLVYQAVLAEPGTLLADAMMLETHIGYGGRRSLSSWIPGNGRRDGDILSLPILPEPAAGTVALWFSPLGDLTWRTLLCIDNGVGWRPDLRLDLRLSRSIEVAVSDRVAARKTLTDPLRPGQWHHVAATWCGPEVIVYLDGHEVVRVAEAPLRARMGRMTLGGVTSNTSPAVRADAVLDEWAYWSRALTAEEVSRLAARRAPLQAGLDTGLTLADLEPIHTFARDDLRRLWRLRLTNRGDREIAGAKVRYGVSGVWQRAIPIVPVPARSACDLSLPWSPASVQPGDYTFEAAVEAKGLDKRFACAVTVVPARPPQGSVQVINWSGLDEGLRALGVTSAGLTGGPRGPAAHEVDAALRSGLYVQVRQFLSGAAQSEADRFVDVAGKPGEVDQRSAPVVADLAAKVEVLAAGLARFPDVRQVIINSEHQWISAHDARPATVAHVKQRFGLDLGRWIERRPEEARQVTHPLGRLAAKAGAYPPPARGIVAPGDPFYAYHRWWHSDGVGNEIFLNDTIARGVHARAPWIACMGEPVLRRPAVRAFREQDIVEEWFYYPDPSVAVWVQEAAVAAARGSRAKIAGMPQFLLKPGMAAPYGGMPTPHLYREAVWHCIARPLRALIYWNLGRAAGLVQSRPMATQEDIDRLLGPKPDWRTAESRIQRKGEWTDVFLFIPELAGEIARMHRAVVHPLGPLLVRWQNRPRALAVYRSLAAQLFNDVRWPGQDPLSRLVQHLGIPFDVLYDEDFEDEPRLLDGYQVVVLPQCAAVTAPAAAQLDKFLARGGLVVADDSCRVELPGLTRFAWRGATDEAARQLQDIEQDLLRQFGRPDHPGFIEGMEQAAARFTHAEGPTAQAAAAIRGALKLACVCHGRSVLFNLLQAEGANYLVAVNDLRVPGRHYGHFGRVREDGVPQSASFELERSLGQVAYQLPSTTRLPLEREGARQRVRLELPAAGGCVVVLLPEEIAALELDTPPAPAVGRGATLTLAGRLLGQSGRPVPGVIPAEVVLRNPDGSRHDFSQYGAFVGGRWSMELPIAYNAPEGTYRLEVRELASAKTAAVQWTLPPRAGHASPAPGPPTGGPRL